MPDLPIQQSQKELNSIMRLNESRNRYRNFERQQIDDLSNDESSQNTNSDKKEAVSFPLGMFFLAMVFDGIGMIPFINFVSEPIAGLIFWYWQKKHTPKSKPVATVIYAKLIDLLSLGAFPSNTGTVVWAYMKERFNVGFMDAAKGAAKGFVTGGVVGAERGAAMAVARKVRQNI